MNYCKFPGISTKIIVGALAALLLSVNVASANITPTLVSVTPSGSNFKWTYKVEVDAAQDVAPGNFFTIYDFDGFVSGSNTQPTDWLFSSANTGLTPPSVLPADSASSPNLTWTWNGDLPIHGAKDLGCFTAVSAYDLVKDDSFAGRGTRNSGPNAGSGISNVGTVPTPSGTPEPASLGLLGMGILPILRKRFRKA